MWGGLEEDIVRACLIKIRDYERHRKRVFDENKRRTRRCTGAATLLVPRRPVLWDIDPGLDPFHVRAHAKSISHSITSAMRAGGYTPRRPAGFRVAKTGRSSRLVGTFAIADEVISARLYRSLLRKNRPRLSARSYAYRDDIGVYDAIAHIQSEWGEEQRIFVAEYDFTDFFDSISHEHIWNTVRSLGLTMTSLEHDLLRAFLSVPPPYVTMSEKALTPSSRTCGVLQGTSISLLLANIAASPLDRSLERLGVGFARYADDTLIWSKDYASICRAVEELHAMSSQIGSPINQEKSMGVRLLVPPETKRAEMPSTSEVMFLSHSLGLRSVRMKPEAEELIKDRISALLFNNLIREPLKGTQDLSRLTAHDKDYVTYIWQLRRYLYGHLAENAVRRLGRASIPRHIRLTGAMAQFPLITDDEPLRRLDGWISTQTWLALRKREQTLGPRSIFHTRPEPWGRSRKDLLNLMSKSATTEGRIDLRLPSTLRMAQVVRKAVRTHGTTVVGRGVSLYVDA